MLNLCAFTGRLVANPELRTTPSGLNVTSFTIAVERPFQRSGAERVADFFDCVAWRNNADFITKFFKKGNLITVQGYMTTRTYDDKQGIKRKAYELTVDTAHFCESKRDADNSANNNFAPAQTTPQNSNNAVSTAFESGTSGDFEIVPSDDDLPF